MAQKRAQRDAKSRRNAEKTKAAALKREQDDEDSEEEDSEEEESNNEEIARLKKEHADEQKASKVQMANLQQRLSKSKASAERHGQGNSRDEPKTPHEKAVAKMVKEKVFPHCKFINGKIGLKKWSVSCGEMMGEYEGFSGNTLTLVENAWNDENSDLVRTGLNEARNYAQSQCRNKAQKLLGQGKYSPTPEEALVCAMRGDVGKTDLTMAIFELYWDELLFCILGKPNWDTVCVFATTAVFPPPLAPYCGRQKRTVNLEMCAASPSARKLFVC